MNMWVLGRYDAAEPILRDTLARRTRVLGAAHRDTHMTRKYLGILLHYTDRLEDAEQMLRAAALGHAAALGEAHPDALSSMLNLGILLRDAGGSAAARVEGEATLRRVLGARREVLGGLHPQTLDACTHVAFALEVRGELVEAEALLAESLQGRLEVLGEGHWRTRQSARCLAEVQRKLHGFKHGFKHGFERGRRFVAAVSDCAPVVAEPETSDDDESSAAETSDAESSDWSTVESSAYNTEVTVELDEEE
jgi:hypothetical protein